MDTVLSTYRLALPELIEQIASAHADLFFVRIDQVMSDSTIPLRQAATLIESIDQMIRTAAISAHNPQSSGRGRIPEFVSDFLKDDIRMGHTKKGSFVLTVAARIDESETQMPDRSSRNSDSEHIPSFTRQVMVTLAKSLDVTRRFAANQAEFAGVGDAVAQGLKLQIVQALQEMSDAEGLRALDLSFEWASAEPQRTSVPTHVCLSREMIDVLPEIERRLVRSTAPQEVTIVGPVKELKMIDGDDVSDDEHGGEIVVHAEIDNKMRRIVVPLNAEDYNWAIAAHRARLPFTATGTLGKRGNLWRLSGPIRVDRSFLEFQLKASDE
ncbi:hypothetical protein [Nocardia bovistercoris]|uniref:Uncharacterized protein n=1 Tax=Nocardia bovistercoris TaxID=2785916 RepID=A0A931N2Y6_9NOCA|nr:hypothetical protein [Nocardia bovistercoris]MBH0780020.1 hypothetical protein [Nocardia bovistercoris]